MTFPFMVVVNVFKVVCLLCFLFRDDHGFSPLHWAAKEGNTKIVEMLLLRGARVNTSNRGDDTPLHLAAAHGHRDVVLMVGIFVYIQ